MAKIHSADSFEAYLQMSDSIFIIGQNPDDFVEQISSFLCSCYSMTSHAYSHPEDISNPMAVTMKVLKTDSDGSYLSSNETANWYPNIFRGGISYGEAVVISAFSIFRNTELIPEDEKKIIDFVGGKIGTRLFSNVIGKAVVEAVELERSGRAGPKLYLSNELVNALGDERKAFVKAEPDGKSHYLWPAYFIDSFDNDIDEEWKSNFDAIVCGSVNLYKYHKNTSSPRIVEHYKEFIKLVADAFIAVSKLKNEAENRIYLLKNSFTKMGFASKECITEFNIEL